MQMGPGREGLISWLHTEQEGAKERRIRLWWVAHQVGRWQVGGKQIRVGSGAELL